MEVWEKEESGEDGRRIKKGGREVEKVNKVLWR
jgi:hypothetical protein